MTTVSPAQELARSMLDQKPIEIHSVLHTLTFRVPSGLLAQVDAIAKRAGMSRNKALSILTLAGIEQTLSELPPEEAEKVKDDAADRLLGLAQTAEWGDV